MRRYLALLMGFTLLLSGMTLRANEAEIRVYLDSRPLSFDVPPTVVEGSTVVPLRTIFEALGAQVGYDAATRAVYAQRGGTGVVLMVGSRTAWVNGQAVPLAVPAQIVSGRTLVPLRFVSEALGATVRWDGGTRTVSITSGSPWSTWTSGYGSWNPGSVSPAYPGGQARPAEPKLAPDSVMRLDPLPPPGWAPRYFGSQPCPRLEDLVNYLHKYTPTWEQLECHIQGLERRPEPALAVASRILDLETDAQYVPDSPWRDERFVEHYKYQYQLLEQMAREHPVNVTGLMMNGLPPYQDETGQVIAAPFSLAHQDLKLRGAAAIILVTKKQGWLPVQVVMGYADYVSWPRFQSAAEVRQWTREYFVPIVEREAKLLERLRVEYYGPFPKEVEVFFSNTMQPALNENLSPPEVLAVAQEFADTVLAAVRRHFSGAVIVHSYANYETHGQFWDGMSYKGFDQVLFTVMPGCDLDMSRKYYAEQFRGYQKIIARSGIPWGIGEFDLIPRLFRVCETDVQSIEVDLYQEFFKVMDSIQPAPVSLNFDMLFQSPEVEQLIRAYIKKQDGTAVNP